MALHLEKYQYDGPTTEDQLRLLTLKPSTHFDHQIECSLETEPRQHARSYTALSYCWGPPNQDQVRIRVNNSYLEINEELASALRYLRYEQEDRVLWIDAICIDQKSISDKNAQVINMDNTYGKAHEVIVYLGEPSSTEASSLAIAAIDLLGSKLEDVALNAVPTVTLKLPSEINGVGPEKYAPAMLHLLQRPWFHRLWVIQEICLAPLDVKIVCGHDEVSFWKLVSLQSSALGKELFVASVHVPTINRHQFLVHGQEPPIGLTRQYFVAEKKGKPEWKKAKCTLLSHLWNFRNRKCSQAIDRVYGLLGIACDITKSNFKPDYGITVSEAFTNVTRLIITKHENLDIMGMCQGPDDQETRPSWVPDFDLDPSSRPPSSLTVYMVMEPYYKATSISQANVHQSMDSSELILDGYYVDTVADLGYDNPEQLSDWAKALQRSDNLARKLAAGKSKYKDTDDAFWRTLITNRNMRREPAIQEIEGAEFKLWWENIFTDPRTRPVEIEKSYIHYQSAWIQHYLCRNFFTTQEGYMGLCPVATRAGDHICLLAGSQVPFVIRTAGAKYQIIGECYVHGIMDGSLWDKMGETVKRMVFPLI